MGNYESLAILLSIALVVYIFDRKNFTREGIVFMRRTRKGLRIIDSIANKHPKLIAALADAGIMFSFGFLGTRYLAIEKKKTRLERIRSYSTYVLMFGLLLVPVYGIFFGGLVEVMEFPVSYYTPLIAGLILFTFLFGMSGYGFMTLFFGAISIFLSTTAGTEVSSSIQLVLPVEMPEESNVPVFSVPFTEWFISILVILVVHEFSHAIVARREKIKVKSLGYGFFGIIPLGFAEPDEDEIKKSKSIKKTRIYGAGSFSNILTAVIMLILYVPLMIFGYSSGILATEKNGVLIAEINGTLPAKDLPVGGLITVIDGTNITTLNEFVEVMDKKSPGENISFMIDNKPYEVTLVSDPANETHAKLGVLVTQGTKDHFITTLVYWIVILSIGIALANLFPMKPLDGGLMLEEVLIGAGITGIKDRESMAKKISQVTLALLLFSLFIPWLVGLI